MFLLQCPTPLAKIFLGAEWGWSLRTHQLFLTQCLARVLKTCLLGEWMGFSKLIFVRKTREMHRHLGHLKNKLDKTVCKQPYGGYLRRDVKNVNAA